MQKGNKKILAVCSLASLVISSSVVSTGVKAASAQPSSTRISGTDRYETAVQVSKIGWTSSDYVVIANGQGYADALCANPLAKSKNAPIILTQSDSLSSSAIAEIKRLNVKHAIIVGGTGVVKASIENTIKSQTSADITRYAGADRYETSAKIAAAIGNTSKIVLASGQGFADALSAGPAAAIEGNPILLTQTKSLPKTISDYISGNHNITKTYVIGGTASVGNTVFGQVPGAQRLGGVDRFATNAAVINAFSSDFDFKNLYAALGVGPKGNEFADALTGGVLAAKNKSALVITSNPLSSYTKQLLTDKLNVGSTITVLGGTANISDTVVSELKIAVTTDSNGSSSVVNLYGDKIKNVITNSKIISKYFDVDTLNSQITLSVKADYKDKVVTPSEIFANASTQSADKIKEKLDIMYDLASNNVNLVTTDTGKTFKDILNEVKSDPTFASSKYAKYITDDAAVDTELLSNDIHDKAITYSEYQTFVSKLGEAAKSSITDKATTPKISVKNGAFTISRIDQGSTTLFDSSKSRITNINLILGLNEDGTPTNAATSMTGTYKIYADDNNSNNYFEITVK